jgi:hypothetical protein
MANIAGGSSPAFPTATTGGNPIPGMTLRDWFASVALAGLCANSSPEFEAHDAGNLAQMAYAQADAMLTRRKA